MKKRERGGYAAEESGYVEAVASKELEGVGMLDRHRLRINTYYRFENTYKY